MIKIYKKKKNANDGNITLLNFENYNNCKNKFNILCIYKRAKKISKFKRTSKITTDIIDNRNKIIWNYAAMILNTEINELVKLLETATILCIKKQQRKIKKKIIFIVIKL